MDELLKKARKHTDECEDQIQELDIEKIEKLEKKYGIIVMKEIDESQTSQNLQRKGKRGVNPKTKARNLLDRFIEHKKEILRLIKDLKIPFGNNQAERDIRMMKLQQKISGTFRTTRGVKAFCKIRAYISTIRKNSLPVLEGIPAVLKGTLLTIPYTLSSYHFFKKWSLYCYGEYTRAKS